MSIVQRLTDQGYLAYFAGGCVRDRLLSIEPHDYDVATNATPMQVREVFGVQRTLLVGASFGVVCVHQRISGQRYQVEVATFRSDGSYSDGRRPDSVRYTTPEEDALRRDFTINGLFYDPIDQRVIDYVGGVDDLHRGILRAIGNPVDRFGEDKLRLLRAIRFAARFGFQLEESTENAICALATTLQVVSPERIAGELRKTAPLERRKWAIEKISTTGLLHVVLPILDRAWSNRPSSRELAMNIVDGLDSRGRLHLPFETFLAALTIPSLIEVRSQARAVLGQECRRLAEGYKADLRLSNEEVDNLSYLLRAPLELSRETDLPWSAIQPFLADHRVADMMILLESLSAAEGVPLRSIPTYREALTWPIEQLAPAPWIDGGDLKKMGFQPSPRFAEILQQVRALQLDQQLHSREEALAWVQRLPKD